MSEFSAEKLNATPDIINNLSWADIVKIWFYELGNASGFNLESPLMFSGFSKTTQEIVSHPMWKKIESYSTARYESGHYDSFTILVHYDVKTFFKAAISNDVILNFLGSFDVIVIPNFSEAKIKFSISNDLTMESASRFQEDYSVISPIDNKRGVLKNKLRTDPNSLHIGGSIRCIWEWQKEM